MKQQAENHCNWILYRYPHNGTIFRKNLKKMQIILLLRMASFRSNDVNAGHNNENTL